MTGQPQKPFAFNRLDDEIGLASALQASCGRDVFAGISSFDERKAIARIAIVMNHLEAEYGAAFARIYGEAIPVRVRINPLKTQKGRAT